MARFYVASSPTRGKKKPVTDGAVNCPRNLCDYSNDFSLPDRYHFVYVDVFLLGF